MKRFNVDDIAVVKDCEYARRLKVVGEKVKIVSICKKDFYDFDYEVQYLNSSIPYKRDYFNENELQLLKKEIKNEQIIHNKSFNVHEASKVIYNGKATIVILNDGSKGIAKCSPEDTYDKYIGFEIALRRALIKKLNKELKILTK